MTKTKNETNELQKIKYHQRKRKAAFVKNALTGIIIVLAVLFYLYANSIRQTNADTAGTVQDIRTEIRKLRDSTKQQFDGLDKKLLQQDQKLEGIKVTKAEQARSKSSFALASQRPFIPRGDVGGRIQFYFGANARIAQAIFTSESGLNPIAHSPTGDFGVAQVNLAAHWSQIKGTTTEEKINALYDVEYNLQLAVVISHNGSVWTPWSDFKNGKYLRYL